MQISLLKVMTMEISCKGSILRTLHRGAKEEAMTPQRSEGGGHDSTGETRRAVGLRKGHSALVFF